MLRGGRNGRSSSRGASSSGTREDWRQRPAQHYRAEAQVAHRGNLPIETLAAEAQQWRREGRLGHGTRCRFGEVILPIRSQGDQAAFINPLEMPVDQTQKALLDAIWTSQTRYDRLTACRALNYYFLKIMIPPAGRNFSYYAMISEGLCGIYSSYGELANARTKAGLAERDDFMFRGFYSFDDAFDYIWDRTTVGTYVEYTIREPREGPLLEALAQRMEQLEEEAASLKETITKLKEEIEDLRPAAQNWNAMDARARVHAELAQRPRPTAQIQCTSRDNRWWRSNQGTDD